MNTKEVIKFIILMPIVALMFVGTLKANDNYMPANDFEISHKLGALCQEHTDKDCQDIVDYCLEAISNNQACYIID